MRKPADAGKAAKPDNGNGPAEPGSGKTSGTASQAATGSASGEAKEAKESTAARITVVPGTPAQGNQPSEQTAQATAADPEAAGTARPGDNAKTSASATTQTGAEDSQNGTAKPAKYKSVQDKSVKDASGKDKPPDASKTPDSSASEPDASQATAANVIVAAVVAPVVAPTALGPAKPAANDTSVDANGAAKSNKLAALQAGKDKRAGEATGRAETEKPEPNKLDQPDQPNVADKADQTAATSNGKPQAAADTGKQPAAHTGEPTVRNSHHAPGDTAQAQPTGNAAHAAVKADAVQPPQVTPPMPAVQQGAGSAPAAQQQQQQPPLPQAVAVPLAGVAIDIAGKALAGKNRFEIRLDPPELGRVEVRLDVDKDGSITSHVIADRKDTLDLLQRDASGLQRALQDAGLKTADNGLQFSLRDQSGGQQQNGNGSPPAGARLVVEDDGPAAIGVTPNGYGRLARLNGGLDIRV